MHLSTSILPAALAALAAPASCHAAQSPPIDEAAAPSYRSHMLDLHRSLIEISSTSGLETAIGEYINEYFVKNNTWNTAVQLLPGLENTPKGVTRLNVLAWPGKTKEPQPRVVLSSHIDAVPPFIPYKIYADSEEDITKDTVIYGRGSVDAKGSVAAMVTAVEDLLSSEKVAAEDIMLAFVVGEEVGGDGMRHLSDALSKLKNPPEFEAVIFGEPTENKLACGHKGGLTCTLKAHGVAAHSGYPHLGKSANELIVRAMVKIFDTDLGSSEEYGNTTVNLGTFHGGVAANVIPEYAEAKIMVRVALGPQETGGDIVKKKLQEILNEVDDEAFEFACSQGYGFVKTDCDVEGFDTMVASYGTDVPLLKGDFTRYLYGPGTILVAHGAHENLTVGDLETAVEGYQKLVLHVLEGEKSDEYEDEL